MIGVLIFWGLVTLALFGLAALMVVIGQGAEDAECVRSGARLAFVAPVWPLALAWWVVCCLPGRAVRAWRFADFKSLFEKDS